MKSVRIRALCGVFLLTCTLLSLGPLFLLVEGNIQEALHGQFNPSLQFTLQEGVPTLSTAGPLPAASLRLQQGILALLPVGVREAVCLLRRELSAAATLWERLL
ncbi:MAG: hypothetical protein IJO76_02380 [Clostridia bacterium]|nr:hypothetical protein [Clostridia bacterium]